MIDPEGGVCPNVAFAHRTEHKIATTPTGTLLRIFMTTSRLRDRQARSTLDAQSAWKLITLTIVLMLPGVPSFAAPGVRNHSCFDKLSATGRSVYNPLDVAPKPLLHLR